MWGTAFLVEWLSPGQHIAVPTSTTADYFYIAGVLATIYKFVRIIPQAGFKPGLQGNVYLNLTHAPTHSAIMAGLTYELFRHEIMPTFARQNNKSPKTQLFLWVRHQGPGQ